MKSFLVFAACCLCVGVGYGRVASTGPASTIDLGTLTRHDTLRLRVDVESTEVSAGAGAVRSMARRAFGAHGAFCLTPKEEAQWVLTFHILEGGDADPQARVSLKAHLESSKGVRMEASLKGALAQTTLKLCDWALEVMQPKLKGFFASDLVFVHDQGKKPGGNKLSVRELCAGSLFFDYVEQLTQDRKTVVSPRLSPDRKKILYTSNKTSGFNDLFEYDRVTRKNRSIAAYNGTNTGGVYAPVGGTADVQMVMILSNAGSPMPYVADKEGKNLRRLVKKKPLSINASPSFSPDGKRIVFTSSGMSKKPQLYVKDIRSSKDPERLRPQLANSYYEPAWNPVDPDIIAFIAPTAGSLRPALYSMKKHLAQWIPIRLGPSESAVELQWCRDGRHVVYTRRTPRVQRLHLLDTLTGKDTPLTPEDFSGSTLQAHLQ